MVTVTELLLCARAALHGARRVWVTDTEWDRGALLALYAARRVMGLAPYADGDDAFLVNVVGVQPLSTSGQGEDVRSVMECVSIDPFLALEKLSSLFLKLSVLRASIYEGSPVQNDPSLTLR